MAGFRVGLEGTAGVIAALVAAAPAGASLSYAESGPAATTMSQGSNFVPCPLSSFAIGGGAYSTGSYDVVAINTSYPGSTSWYEYTDVFSGTQTHYAYAICDSTKPKQHSESKTLEAGDEKTVRAACPPSKHVYGGGYYSSGGYLTTLTRSSRPYAGNDEGWEATTFSYSNDKEVTTYALCGPKRTTVRTKTADVDPTSQGLVRKKCGSGEQVTGGGANIAVGSAKGWISSIYPNGDHQWGAYLENTSSKKREMTVYAVCR